MVGLEVKCLQYVQALGCVDIQGKSQIQKKKKSRGDLTMLICNLSVLLSQFHTGIFNNFWGLNRTTID
jgi:hypothetical protein